MDLASRASKKLSLLLSVRSFFVGVAAVLILTTNMTSFLSTFDAHAVTIIPDNFVHSDYVTGLRTPTAMDFAPDGRIFVTEKGGAVRVVKDGALLTSSFVTVSVNSVGERGLLGIAFDPDYESNGFLYLYYTTSTIPIHNRISRFTADPANPDRALAGSEMILLDLETLSSATNHNAGAIHFGNDGKLYIATGDNANSANSQSLTTKLGKILRINSNGSVPTDNPFFNTVGAQKSIWALGLRNPFTFAINPEEENMIYINDVGENKIEEINQGISGGNYGWPACEGPCSDPRYIDPLHSYEHTVGRAISGGAFYVENQFPAEYHGSYFFGDYVNNFIKRLSTSANGTPNVSEFMTDVVRPVDIKIGPDGSLYYLSITEGKIGQVRYVSGANNFPFAIAQANPTSGPAPLVVSFDASNSGDPDGDALTFTWEFGDGSTSTATKPSHTYTNSGPYTAKLTVRDGKGGEDVALVDIRVGNSPVGTINTPLAGTHYNAGQTITFSGSASDIEDGNDMQASAFTWEVLLHHNIHTHPFMIFDEVKEGQFVIPDTGETSADVWYRIYLKVTDSSGLDHVSIRDIIPNKSTMGLDTNFPGLTLNLDGQPQTTPAFTTGVVGMKRTIGAPLIQNICGAEYEFQSWSDGGAASHIIVTPTSDTTYAATYKQTSGKPPERTIDFNGDGFSDLAIGVPEEDVGSRSNAGAVNVIYGSSSGLSATAAISDQFWSQDSAGIEDKSESGDNFGSSLAVGDFNGDRYSDLAIGVPREDIGGSSDAGAVNVIYGSNRGLSSTVVPDQIWHQNQGAIEGGTENGDNFGSSLAVGDFNGDGYDDLAIGVSGEAIGNIAGAGAVSIIYGSVSGLSDSKALADQFWSQDSAGIEDNSESGDNFGWSLSSGDFNGDRYSDLAIGAIGENALTGSVNIIYGSASGLSPSISQVDQFWTQDSPDVEGSNEGGDRFGYSLASADFNCDGSDDLAIGALEQNKTPNYAGAVNVLYGSSSSGLSATIKPDQIWTQDSVDIEDTAEADDKFGSSLAVGDFDGDGFLDLAIGAPSEDVGTTVDAGSVNIIYGSSEGLSPTGDQLWHQNTPDVQGGSETGDMFGSALTAADFNNDGADDLTIGVPREDLGSVPDAGMVNVIYGSSTGLSATAIPDQTWEQNTSNIEDSNEANDRFGSGLG